MTEEEKLYHQEWRDKKRTPERQAKLAAYQREYRKTHQEAMKASEAKTYKNNTETRCAHQRDYRRSNLPRVMFGTCRKKSARIGLPFDLTLDYIQSIWPKDDRCPILGTPFEIAAKGSNRNTSASIDRIVASKGYTQGNVVIISMLANRIKNNATPEQVLAVANYFLSLEA